MIDGFVLAMLLVSPGSWTVHFALLYLPVAVLAARASRGDRLPGAVVLLLGLIATLPAFSHFLADWISATSALTIGSLIALATLLARPASRRTPLEAGRALASRAAKDKQATPPSVSLL